MIDENPKSLSTNLEIENKTDVKSDIIKSNEEISYLINIDDIAQLKKEFDKFKDFDKLQNFNSNKKAINLKYMNIVDPIFPTNNLGKSVNFHNFSKIKKIFEYASKEVDIIIASRNNTDPYNYLNLLLKMFNKTVTFYNSELFYYSLPQPKIIITPKNMEFELNENSKNMNNSMNNELIKKFNKLFSLTNKSSNEGTLSNNNHKSTFTSSNINDVKNNLNNFVWPSR